MKKKKDDQIVQGKTSQKQSCKHLEFGAGGTEEWKNLVSKVKGLRACSGTYIRVGEIFEACNYSTTGYQVRGVLLKLAVYKLKKSVFN